MATANSIPLIAIDVGNTRIKLGDFAHPLEQPLPHPRRTLSLAHDWAEAELTAFTSRPAAECVWRIASVNRPAAARLVDWLGRCGATRVEQLTCGDLPLEVDLPRPDLVGIDRLANAVAVNRLRDPRRPALVIDFGSAITVDLVSARGGFAGGAIAPGIAMAARALEAFTDLLPLVEVNEPPPALGKSTLEAISSGLYWGTIGAVRELVRRLSGDSQPAQIFLTGGGAPEFAAILAEDGEHATQFVPHLTLAGIALAVPRAASAKDSR
jgi:type III pantothenate kinase